MVGESMYQMGFALGRHWGVRDANEAQLLRVKEFGDGREWVSLRGQSAEEFTRIVDPGKDGFMGVGDNLSSSFVAGFIDGAQTIGPAS